MKTVISRILSSIAAVIGASIVSFIFLRLLPSNPARLILGQFATERAIHEEIKAMGLDQPIWVQYWLYIKGFVQGNWGFAYSIGQPVTTAIGSRLPASIELGLYAFLLALSAAVIAALLATYRGSRFIDGFVQGAASFGL